jgi:hypothetical protein
MAQDFNRRNLPQKSKKTKQRNKLFAKRISEALSILLEQ